MFRKLVVFLVAAGLIICLFIFSSGGINFSTPAGDFALPSGILIASVFLLGLVVGVVMRGGR